MFACRIVFLLVFISVWNLQVSLASSCESSASNSKVNQEFIAKKAPFTGQEIVHWVKNLNRKKDPFFPVSKITPENAEQAVDILLRESLIEIQKIADSSEKPTFTNLVLKIENALRHYSTFSGLFSAVASTKSAEFAEVRGRIGSKVSEFNRNFTNNEKLREKVSVLLKNMENRKLSFEMKDMLKGYKESFQKLSKEKEDRLIEIGEELRQLSTLFSKNLMDFKENASIEFKLEELKGLSAERLAAAKALAEKESRNDYLFKTDNDTVMAFVTTVESAEARAKFYKLLSLEGLGDKETDNLQIIKRMLLLKEEAAKIEDFESYAALSIKNKAAPSVEEVKSFLERLADIYYYNAKKEIEQLRSFKEEHTGSRELKAWDLSYWREKLQEEVTGASDLQMMPYFEFYTFQRKFHERMEQIYGVEIRERKDLDAINEDGQVFELLKDGKLYAYFITDIFERTGKRGGAWMSQARTGYRDKNSIRKIPTAVINLNIKKTPETQDSNLMFPSESITYAHEFGHALHLMLSNTRFMDHFGVKVPWDVVEVPSQFNENFVLDRDFIKTFAFHHKTGEPIPDSYIDSFLSSNQFFAGFSGLSQVKRSLLDLEVYSRNASEITDLIAFEGEFSKKFNLIDPSGLSGSSLASFSHIFAGGYAAGYYSYKWAEVIEADAFSIFQKEGLNNPETAKRWIDNVLSIGGSKDFDKGIEAFLGRKMDPSALIKRSELELPEED